MNDSNTFGGRWLQEPEQWDRLAEALVKAGEFGIDTETYNQPDKTSPQWRTRVHCWSVGVLTTKVSPRGYRLAIGRVLPHAALFHPSIREVLENAGTVKWAHNAPHDEHSILNEGIGIRGLQDSLQWLRVAAPGRSDYGLKDAEGWALGLPGRPNFADLVNYKRETQIVKSRRVKGCVCGKVPCHARSTSDYLDDFYGWRPHTRVSWRVFHPELKLVDDRYPVESFSPEHPRWSEWLDYSLADAVRGIMLVDWIRNRRQPEVAYPWKGT